MNVINLQGNAYANSYDTSNANLRTNSNTNLNTTEQGQNENLVSDRFLAKSQMLGFGVDKDGYFTQEFNEAAGLPKDFKIHTKGLNDLVSFLTTKGSFATFQNFEKIDLAQSFKKAYESFVNDENFIKTEDKGADLKLYFGANLQEFLEGKITTLGRINGFDRSISKQEMQDFKSFMNENRITNPFINPANFISAMIDPKNQEVLSVAVFSEESYESVLSSSWDYLADTFSFNSSYMSAKENYKEFADLAAGMKSDFLELLHSNVSLQDFKAEYLKLKERHDEFIEKIKGLHKEKFQSESPAKAQAKGLNVEVKKEQEHKIFTPIKGQSDSTTYTKNDAHKYFFLQFIKSEMEKGTNILELLQKLSNSDTIDVLA